MQFFQMLFPFLLYKFLMPNDPIRNQQMKKKRENFPNCFFLYIYIYIILLNNEKKDLIDETNKC